MQHTLFLSALLLFGTTGEAQIIYFEQDVEAAELHYRCSGSSVGRCVDSSHVDAYLAYDVDTGAVVEHIDDSVMTRYEFWSNGNLYRYIDVRSNYQTDTLFVDDMTTGDRRLDISFRISDRPNGAYRAYFPNGDIQISGSLDGYDSDGSLKKVGEWIEWDKEGKELRRSTYP